MSTTPSRRNALPSSVSLALGALAGAARSKTTPTPQAPKQRPPAPKPAAAAAPAPTRRSAPPTPAPAKKPQPPSPAPPVPAAPPAPSGGGANPVTKAARLAVWVAEDGRCESCHRAMDRRLARTTRIDPQRADWSPDNLHLLCPFCARGLPDPLSAPLTIAPETLAAVQAATGAQDAEGTALAENLRRYGVLVLDQVWLPGVGTFVLRNGAPPGVTVVRARRLYDPPLRVCIRPQQRSRRLPPPRFPAADLADHPAPAPQR